MKRVIFSTVVLLGCFTIASAQTTNRSKSTVSKTSKTTANTKAAADTPVTDNRKIYHYQNGQRSTPTGAEATPSTTGGQNAAVGQDTAATMPTAKGSASSGQKKRKQ